MRTTLTIADEADHRLRRLAQQQNRSYKDIVNKAIAIGLAQEVHEATPVYEVEPFDAGFVAGIDRRKLNQLVVELELDATLASNDNDFAQFEKLKTINPRLKARSTTTETDIPLLEP